MPLGLYISVPFCRTKCTYCNFASGVFPREREILELIAQGKTNPEIAQTLNLSPKTVSNNVSNVLLKLQATDRAKLMLMALAAGMGKAGSGQ